MKKTLATLAAATTLGVAAFTGSAQAVDVTPFSATNCTGNAGATDGSGSVCITVKGTGLKVDHVSVSKKSNNRSWTDYARIDFTDGSGGYMSATVSAARVETKTVGTAWGLNAAHNSKVCGYWNKYPGTKACATIHR
ncbi:MULTISPECIES: hypothetical protein [unclassified Streptomyces]|uniref:hypothetical protein n=1 Tax=unclassified Streptomyces TaxID=2593676 RepID=UPI0013681458|nr:hypothetical protein [Streptomyces sp. YIM 132580]MXG24844.1 hypothetical protein [Streptomyces sp. YIM 132580]